MPKATPLSSTKLCLNREEAVARIGKAAPVGGCCAPARYPGATWAVLHHANGWHPRQTFPCRFGHARVASAAARVSGLAEPACVLGEQQRRRCTTRPVTGRAKKGLARVGGGAYIPVRRRRAGWLGGPDGSSPRRAGRVPGSAGASGLTSVGPGPSKASRRVSTAIFFRAVARALGCRTAPGRQGRPRRSFSSLEVV
jgi:hypothetical protein